MPRYQSDDNLGDSPEAHKAGTAAMGLYYRCGMYVARYLLDGHVPTQVAADYGTPEWIRRLTDAGLWVEETGGYWMPRYLAEDGNPSREKVLADRAAKAQRQARWLAAKQQSPAQTRRRVSRPSSSASNGASRVAPADDAHPLPTPYGVGDGAVGGAVRGTSGRQLGFCTIHQTDISASGICRGCRADQIANTQ